MPDINWYPGHMAKARRELEESVKGIDAVIEMCDARAPISTRNPDLDKLVSGKTRILVLNKSDLADERVTRRWTEYFSARGTPCLRLDSNAGKTREILSYISDATRERVERMKLRGANKTVRLMVVGVPNVGKSTLINRLRGGSALKTADRPGVTRAKRWIKAGEYLELLDTPGMLWPKLDERKTALTLAWLGSIKDEIMDQEELAELLLRALMNVAPEAARARYKLPDEIPESLLEAAARGRGFLMSGGRLDTARAAAIALDEFRAGKIGRVTLEEPK